MLKIDKKLMSTYTYIRKYFVHLVIHMYKYIKNILLYSVLSGVLCFAIWIHAWDASVSIDTEFEVVSGDTVEYEVQLFNDSAWGAYTDTWATLEVTFDETGLEFVSEGSYEPFAIATLTSTWVNTITWDINSFSDTQFEDNFVRFIMRWILVGSFATTAEIIPWPSAPAEQTTANNTASTSIQVINSIIDGECGTASGAVYYSGYVFNDSPELCVAWLPFNPANANQPSPTTSWFVWDCISNTGGQPDACTADIRYCGDTIDDPEEECDDWWSWSDACTDVCTLTFCGDGTTQATNGQWGSEVCDDGNTDEDDACLNTCQFSFCGDGILQTTNGMWWAESCDDGNGIEDDGCNSSCEITTNGVCGDADGLPVYDVDGNGDQLTWGNSELCSGSIATWFVYSGTTHTFDWTCLWSINGWSDVTCGTTELYCGDSVPWWAEACDDGNNLWDDGCSTICEWEVPSCTLDITPWTGFAPLSVTAGYTLPAWATLVDIDWQDGTINASSTHTYVTTGSFLAQMTVANTDNGAVTATCADLVQSSTECWNGLQEIWETCDAWVNNGVVCDPAYWGSCSYCSSQCRTVDILWWVCGDGIVHLLDGEQCDDGNTENNDACPNDCQLAVCGDAVQEWLETCDDGNTESDDGCDAICVSEWPPPSRKGSSRSTSNSSTFVASTASVDQEEEIDKETNEDTNEDALILEDQSEAEDNDKEHDDTKHIQEHNSPIDIFAFIRSRNFSIMQVIKKRNAYVRQMKLLHDILRERNVVPEKIHAAAPVRTVPTIPTPSIPNTNNTQKDLSSKTESSKAELKAALAQYLMMK